MNDGLERILNPRSVVLVGVSRNEKAWGYRIGKVLLERFRGETFLVNPSTEEILGRRAYRSVGDIAEDIDLAVVAVPTKSVSDAVKECARKRVRGIVVISAGFGEQAGHWDEGTYTFEEGARLQREMVAIARAAGSRIVGPNCMGIDNPSIGLNTWGAAHSVADGRIAFISQSGGMGDLAFRTLPKRFVGLSYFVGVGNEADIQMHEYVRYLKSDSRTSVIALYLEGAKNGRQLLHEAREATRIKPIVALKAGRTEAGSRATASHTGALAGSSAVSDAALRQMGAIRVSDDHELLDVAEALAKCPPLKGNRIAVLTEGGGHAATAADVIESSDLRIPQLRLETQKTLRAQLREHPLAATGNPIDLPGLSTDPHVLTTCARILMESGEIDAILIVGEFGSYASFSLLRGELRAQEDATAQELARLAREHLIPVLIYSIAADDESSSLDLARSGGIPVYDSISRVVRCAAALYEAHRYRERDVPRRPESPPVDSAAARLIARARDQSRTRLLETEVMELLKLSGVRTPEWRTARTPDDAVIRAEEIGLPVVMKIVSSDIAHKSDVGGVRVNLTTADEVHAAYGQIVESVRANVANARIEGVVIYPYFGIGTEVIIGSAIDREFGPVVMFGMGGVFVELMRDVAIRVLPITRDEAYSMIREVRAYPILDGARGGRRVDIEQIADLIEQVGRFAELPGVSSVDLNPVIATDRGVFVADARLLLAE